MNSVFSKQSFNSSTQCSVLKDLESLRNKRKEEDLLLLEIKNILHKSFRKNYTFEFSLNENQLLNDEEIPQENIYTLQEIEKICVLYRLKFLDASHFKNPIPSVAEVKIEYLNDTYNKNISGLKIASYYGCFNQYNYPQNFGILFAPTINGHYYLIHRWGEPISKKRKWQYFPLRTFETLALSVILFTLIVDLILPTHLITLDRTATYWCGYRIGVFFHLLIFFGGLTMFVVISFFKNVSKNIWDSI